MSQIFATRTTRRWLVSTLILVLSALATVGVSQRLRLDPNVAALLPERGESAALRQYLRAFGGSDLAMVLVASRQRLANADAPPDERDAEAVEKAAAGLARELEALASVRFAAHRLDAQPKISPMMVWRHADTAARQALAEALQPENMRTRLQGSRALLLAPGSGAIGEQIAKDPLRLAQLVFESRQVGSGFQTQADGGFATNDELARLVLVFPEGQALRGDDAKAFVRQATAVISRYRQQFPGLEIGLTGGHAIAEATERMLTDDMTLSGTLSMLLASLAFMLTFRRGRAIFAVMPPLLLGTLWTAGIASALPHGLSAIAVAFMSVVIGVGVDTGVHVYAALLEARQEGLSPADAAARARSRTQRPVLVAAATAGAAFASLGLSEIGALRQLGILCAGGEILTALAIVFVTPEIGAYLERSKPPAYRAPRWTGFVASLTATRRRSVFWLVALSIPAVLLFVGYAPKIANAIVAMRPAGLEPLNVQQQIYDTFGGRTGQWVVLIADSDRERALTRADTVADALSTIPEHLDSLDALTAIVPSQATQRIRLAERDALDLPAKAVQLERALADEGFAPAPFERALAEMRSAPHETIDITSLDQGDGALMVSRYLSRDEDKTVVVLYVLPRHVAATAGWPDPQAQNDSHAARVEQVVMRADPAAQITGYGRLDASLRETLLVDLPRIGIVAGILVLLALAAALRRARDVVLAAAVVVAEIGIVLCLVRLLDVPLHAYDALVLPVLLGITVDEGMFLLYRAREGDRVEVIEREGPPVAATALTTAAGFAGLLVCDFDGLRHLGLVGAIGSLTGLVVALLVVPAGICLSTGRARDKVIG